MLKTILKKVYFPLLLHMFNEKTLKGSDYDGHILLKISFSILSWHILLIKVFFYVTGSNFYSFLWLAHEYQDLLPWNIFPVFYLFSNLLFLIYTEKRKCLCFSFPCLYLITKGQYKLQLQVCKCFNIKYTALSKLTLLPRRG